MEVETQKLLQLFFYVPESHLESVKAALFEAGAGQLAGYSQCCWQIKGMGQFKPSDAASPFLGEADQLSQEIEYKVEMLCFEHTATSVLQALLKAHPYEVPAYGFIELRNII